MVVAKPRKDENAEPSSVWPGARDGMVMGIDEDRDLCAGLCAALVVRSNADDSMEMRTRITRISFVSHSCDLQRNDTSTSVDFDENTRYQATPVLAYLQVLGVKLDELPKSSQ
ncbi:hypothetical protein PsorP6_001131 [Peronosclerospora sorghi]|uniref:Uncharacterized protein n=1 Tax=Peronosclerospora sorghi TaxID=230839 RepID=A0ACC0WUS8_9STRA|nr:hypothetical protein PsorP6_001131 [Peronosclerospora sorghi]